MDEQAKQMALQHIEEGEYKQAFAILDDFKADIDAERLLNELDKLVVLDQKFLAAQGGLQDKATLLNIRELEKTKHRLLSLDDIVLTIVLFILLLITTKDFIGGGIFSLICVGIYQVWVNLLDLDRKHILRLALLILLFLLFLAILGSMIG
jgi:hypothetical protein